jgi:hypothetical protein
MRPSQIRWRDWNLDFGGNFYDPFSLETPGQILYCPLDFFQEWAMYRKHLIRMAAMAILCPQHHFVLVTEYAGVLAKVFASDLAPHISREIAYICKECLICNHPKMLPFDARGNRMSREAVVSMAQVLRENAFAAGLAVPPDVPLIPNLWIGWRVNTRDPGRQYHGLRSFIDIPAALRFLYIPGGYPLNFADYVWRDECRGVAGRNDIIDTAVSTERKIHWIIQGGINEAAARYAAEQCAETGTPLWIEGANVMPLDLAIMQYPAEINREPYQTPEIAERERRQYG